MSPENVCDECEHWYDAECPGTYGECREPASPFFENWRWKHAGACAEFDPKA